MQLFFVGNLIFNDEIQSVQEQVNLLKSQGVTKIIALGHAGINVDKAIAEQVTDVDIVVGGHTDTFMYTGKMFYSWGVGVSLSTEVGTCIVSTKIPMKGGVF